MVTGTVALLAKLPVQVKGVCTAPFTDQAILTDVSGLLPWLESSTSILLVLLVSGAVGFTIANNTSIVITKHKFFGAHGSRAGSTSAVNV